MVARKRKGNAPGNWKKEVPKTLGFQDYSAEKEGFEPPEVWPSTVFKTAAFDHSAISPTRANIMFIDFQFVDLIDNIYAY